jgi:hypothetical protein
MSQKPEAPPMELYLIVNEDGEECVCVNSLDKVYFQERFSTDRVFRVVKVEEVEDPRLRYR